VTGVNFLFDLADGAWNLVKMIVLPFWRFTRGLVRAALPGQSRSVHTGVAALLVVFELMAVWYLIQQRVYGS
jgi:hypothetical protein